MTAGGGAHLKDTRCLTLLDDALPPEADSLQPNRLNFDQPPGPPQDEATNRVISPEMSTKVGLILHVLPRNCLHTFRYGPYPLLFLAIFVI